MLWRYSLDANGNAYFHSPQLMPHHRFSSTARVDSPEPLISFLLPGWKKCRNRALQLQLPPTFCSGVEQVRERSNLSITHIQIFAKPLNIKHPIHTVKCMRTIILLFRVGDDIIFLVRFYADGAGINFPFR